MAVLPLTLFGAQVPVLDPTARTTRTWLDRSCWVDLTPNFLLGADTLLDQLEHDMRWDRGRRLMYGTWHDEPRLTGQVAADGHSLPPIIESMRGALDATYGRRFEGLFCNFYRDGADSVAWHADRIGRTSVEPLVAIISLGGPRTFALRPMGGGRSQSYSLHSGDLLIMGGSTQHAWEHSVPKMRHAAPRMSLTMRAGFRHPSPDQVVGTSGASPAPVRASRTARR